MKALPATREKFCNLIALKGYSQYKAYITCYPTAKKWKRNAVDSTASQLVSNPKINQRIEELKAKADEKVTKGFAKTKVDILKKLESLIEYADKSRDQIRIEEDKIIIPMKPTEYTKEVRECLKEQGKLLGFYIDHKEVTNKHSFLELLKNSEDKND
jgi:hypothetical protein